ncbi:MAG: hypothetical protein ACKVN9_02985 [Methylophilaceae bacterium]
MKPRLFLTLCISLYFRPAFAASHLEIHIGEINHPQAQFQNLDASVDADGNWHGTALLKQTNLNQLAPNFPVKFSKGSLQGKLVFAGKNNQPQQVKADLNLRDTAFSNTEGSKAADKLAGNFNIKAQRKDAAWAWQAALKWREGELFWQPLYFANGGHALEASGEWSEDKLTVTQGLMTIASVGAVKFNGELALPSNTITRLDIDAKNLALDNAYVVLIKPFMEKNVLGDLEAAGRADLSASIKNQRITSFNLGLHGADVADKKNRFAFYKLNVQIPWSYDDKTHAVIGYESGQLLGLSLAAAQHKVDLERYSLVAPHLDFPVLDGKLVLDDVAAAIVNDQWYWRVRADVQGISMPEFSTALGWPRMEGKIQAQIPMVLYQNGKLTSNGTLKLNVFDGDIKVDNLLMDEPLGLVPRLSADITMRRLDLALLTRTFSFGDMEGRLDGNVQGLELSGKQPVKFDARFYSSPGSYPKKISQRAVQNISSLGGAGAAAAIQRSFLSFFEKFNYQAIGLSCRLRNSVCLMGGVEDTPSGYIIVKGSGIPSITVLGYNRNVGWKELLERVQDITKGNSKPVIK